MSLDLLAQAKQRLLLSALMALLGFGERAKKSARCPFHEDSSASFSLYVGDDGEERWKCFAGCGQGDVIDFLAKQRGLSNSDACREFILLAGITPAPAPIVKSTAPLPDQSPFDWQACVTALNPEQLLKLANWRGYAPKFVAWLHSENFVGVFDAERIAFPVHDAGRNIVGCHYRRKEDGSWRYYPTGTRTAPFIIGDPVTAKTILVFESQWDLLAVLDCLHHHIQPLVETAAIATRGAGNARLLAGLCAPDAVVYAFAQNDEAGQKWLADIASNCGRNTFEVVTPPPHLDANDWTLADATRPEIEAAIAAAQPVVLDSAPDLLATSLKNASEPAVELLEADGTDHAQTTFPTECLPPSIACIVRAVAITQRVPDSLPGVMALALVAASCGKGLVLDWRPGKASTPANLFAVVSALSGSGKSECSKVLAKPFLDFERAMQEQWRKAVMPKLQADLRFHEGQLKKLDRKLARDSTSATDSERGRLEMVFHQAQVDELKLKLHEPQLSIQDATVEKVATVLHQNDETIFSTSSDARKLCDNLLGRYSASKKFADDGIYLNAFSGDDVKVDRQGREGVRLANPCMTLLWALQPDAMEKLLDEDSLQQGGFLARCLLAHSNAEPQHIGGDTSSISDEVRAGWKTLIRNLLVTYRQPPTLPAIEIETIDIEI